MPASCRRSARERRILAAAVAAAIAVMAGAACDFGGRCDRAIRSWVLWHVRRAPFVGTAEAVALREGPPDAPGRVLYEFPLVNSVPQQGVVTQVFVRTAYSGRVPFSELWELVQSRPLWFEVVRHGEPRPLFVGPLLRTGFSDWQESCS